MFKALNSSMLAWIYLAPPCSAVRAAATLSFIVVGSNFITLIIPGCMVNGTMLTHSTDRQDGRTDVLFNFIKQPCGYDIRQLPEEFVWTFLFGFRKIWHTWTKDEKSAPVPFYGRVFSALTRLCAKMNWTNTWKRDFFRHHFTGIVSFVWKQCSRLYDSTPQIT